MWLSGAEGGGNWELLNGSLGLRRRKVLELDGGNDCTELMCLMLLSSTLKIVQMENFYVMYALS